MGLVIFMVILTVIAIVVCIAVHRSDDLLPTGGIVAVCAVALIGLGLGNYFASFNNDHVATCYVNSKDRGGEDGSYRIYTENCGVLANQDVILRGKLNSADVWNEIPDSGYVKLHIAGTRIPLLSQFPNILEVVE